MKGFIIGFICVVIVTLLGIGLWVYGEEMWTDTKNKFNEDIIKDKENNKQDVSTTIQIHTNFENERLFVSEN